MGHGDVLQNAPVMGMKKKFPRSFGRYVLEKSLSRGGMGEVLLAIAKGVNQRCVIKTIRGDLTGDEEFVGRFADEAKIMVRISHENIIRVFDAGKVDVDYYIAMEYVHGRDLGDVLDRAYERGEPMPLPLGLYVTAQLLKGLGYAHALTDEQGRHMGLVHRDISPQNVLVGFDGSVKLIDFGLARTDVLPARTQGALAVGKYGYMSPEQARHERIDGRADIYSTGVMLFEVFTGDRLVDEQDQATLWQRVLSPKHRAPRSVIPSLPPEIDQLVMRAVAVRPEDRFAVAEDMLAHVKRLSGSESSREEFVRYLRYLYPKVDFGLPPMLSADEIGPLQGGVEQSIIIATSREGALSVFGRGELPIEWTTQIDADEIRRALRKRRGGRDDFARDHVITDAHATEENRPRRQREIGSEATFVRVSEEFVADAAAADPRSARLHEFSEPGLSGGATALDAPTQIARFPENPVTGVRAQPDEPSAVVTRYSRPPSPTGDLDVGGQEHTIQSVPVRDLRAASYRDDEMTVMMDAPPRGLGRPSQPLDDDGDAPTRLSRLANEDLPTPSVQASAPSTKGRTIRERNIYGERAREPERTQKPDRRDRAKEREERRAARFAVHRATVPTEAQPADRARIEDTQAFSPTGGAEPTVSEDGSQVKYLLPGAVAFGIAILIVILVVLFVSY